ncbi:MAG: hypothetical protein K9G49_15915 [Taibaiella sp.]|nr:hypothetical protein [Taibaiella sp.]
MSRSLLFPSRHLGCLLSLLLLALPAFVIGSPANDTLTPFKITYTSGEEGYGKSEINIYKQNNKYYARNVAPYFFIGTKTDSIWVSELSQDKIQTCIELLNRAKNLPEECPETSSATKEYQITYGNNTIKIRGDCDWEDLDFINFRSQLFYEKFAILEAKRLALIDSLNKQLRGKWHFIPFKNMFNRGDILLLKKVADADYSCTWQMGESSTFSSTCNDVLNLSYSIRYLLNVDGDIYIEIQGGSTVEKNGSMKVRNFGATFTIEAISSEELKLKFLWR